MFDSYGPKERLAKSMTDVVKKTIIIGLLVLVGGLYSAETSSTEAGKHGTRTLTLLDRPNRIDCGNIPRFGNFTIDDSPNNDSIELY